MMKDVEARTTAQAALDAAEALADRVARNLESEVAKQVAPLAEVMRQVQSAQRQTAKIWQGQVESLNAAVKPMQQTVAGMTLQMAALASGLEQVQKLADAASQDANSARVDVTGMLEVVQDIQERLNAQRQAVAQVLSAMEV